MSGEMDGPDEGSGDKAPRARVGKEKLVEEPNEEALMMRFFRRS